MASVANSWPRLERRFLDKDVQRIRLLALSKKSRRVRLWDGLVFSGAPKDHLTNLEKTLAPV